MKAVVLDANLIVLKVVGAAGRMAFEVHKRVEAFDFGDVALLDTRLRGRKVVSCPNILTEASNLVRQGGKRFDRQMWAVFGDFVLSSAEKYVPSRTAIRDLAALDLGLADSAVLALAAEGHPVLTSDFDLHGRLVSRGHKAQNFNHLR